MSETVAQATVRLSIVGPEGQVDLAVPLWSELAAVAAGYAERTGCGPVRLLSATGRTLAERSTIHALRLSHGDVLVAVETAPYRGTRRKETAPEEIDPAELRPGTTGDGRVDSTTGAPGSLSHVPPAAGLLAGSTAAVAALLVGSTAATVAMVGLVVVALGIAVVARGDRPVDTSWVSIAPAFVAGAAVLSIPVDEPGGARLAATVAALAVAAAAAAFRAGAPRVADDALAVQVVAGGVLATIGALCLALDWSTVAMAALVLVVAVLTARFLPALVVDVPDHVLLDFARLAVTAWTAREQPRRSFRGVVREEDVKEVAARAMRLVGATTIITAVAVAVAGGYLLLADTDGARRVGVLVTCGFAGAALVLGGRQLRAATARRWQRSTGTVLLAATTVFVLLALGDGWRTAVAAAAVLLGIVLAVVARAVGRGWSSVWWSRTAEIAEGFAFVVVVGSLPLAVGLVDWMRLLTSP